MARKRPKAPHEARTGGYFVALPHDVMTSAAYVDLKPDARALLFELLLRFNGHNNGKIGLSQRDARARLGMSPQRIVDAFDRLIDHGFVELATEGDRALRLAREWRLTWITSGGGPPYILPTFAYRSWAPGEPVQAITRTRKKRIFSSASVAEGHDPASTSVADANGAASTSVADGQGKRRNSGISQNPACYDVRSAYTIPCPPPEKCTENTDVSDVKIRAAGGNRRVRPTDIVGDGIASQLQQWEEEIEADPEACVEMGYALLLKGARDRCAGRDQLCAQIDRLISALASPPPSQQTVGRPPRNCERCSEPFELTRQDRAKPRRFCSEQCRKSAERARAHERARASQTPIIMMERNP